MLPRTQDAVKSASLPLGRQSPIKGFIEYWESCLGVLRGERYGMDAVPFALVGWCVVLFGSAAWLNQVLFRRTKTFFPFLAAIATILLSWLWQKHAFAVLVPGARLTYGYFLKPEGTSARHWVLTYPLWAGLVCLSACFIAALVSAWAAGARRSLVCLLPWWVAAFIVFALPSMYLDAQGNASVFI
jgi:hypothetical protein